MSNYMSLREQVEYIIKEKPGISSSEIADFFDGLPNAASQASACLTHIYAQGGWRREKTPQSGRAFCYWHDPDFKPEVKRRQVAPTNNGLLAQLDEALAEVSELRAWKEAAIKRFPDLAVSEIVLKARKIVAETLSHDEDHRGARDVLDGRRDCTALMRATIAALEAA